MPAGELGDVTEPESEYSLGRTLQHEELWCWWYLAIHANVNRGVRASLFLKVFIEFLREGNPQAIFPGVKVDVDPRDFQRPPP